MPKIFFLDFDFIKNFKISMRGIFFWYLRNPKFFWILQIFFALFVQIFFSFFFPLLFLFKFFIFNKFSNKANFWTFFLIHIISSHFTCFKFIICLEFDFSPTFLLILAFYIYFQDHHPLCGQTMPRECEGGRRIIVGRTQPTLRNNPAGREPMGREHKVSKNPYKF